MRRRLWVWMSVLCVLTLVGIVVVKIRVEYRRSVALEAKRTSTAAIDAMLAETSAAAEMYAPEPLLHVPKTAPPISSASSTITDKELIELNRLVTILAEAMLKCDGVWPTPEDLESAKEECQTLRNMGRFPSIAEKLDPSAFPVATVLDTLKPILEEACARPVGLSPLVPKNNDVTSKDHTLCQGALALLRAREGDVDGAIAILTSRLVSAADVNGPWESSLDLWGGMARVVALKPFSPDQRKALLEPLEAAYTPERIRHQLLLMAKRKDAEIAPQGGAGVKMMYPAMLFPLEFSERTLPKFRPPFDELFKEIAAYKKQITRPSFGPTLLFMGLTESLNEWSHRHENDYESPFLKSYSAIEELESTVNRMALAEIVALDHCAGARLVFKLRDYKTAHGAYPDTLDALVPELMPALPVSAWDEAPFVYERTEPGFLLTLGAKPDWPQREPIRFRVE